MKTLLFLVALMLLALPAWAQDQGEGHEVLGLTVHPYGALTFTRIAGDSSDDVASGTSNWSTGAWFGAEVEAGPMFVGISYRLRDILTEGRETYPWDGEFEIALGGYW